MPCPFCRASWREPLDDARFRAVVGEAAADAAPEILLDDVDEQPIQVVPSDAIIVCCPRLAAGEDGLFEEIADARTSYSEYQHRGNLYREYVCHTCHRSIGRDLVEVRMSQARVDPTWWCSRHRRTYYLDIGSSGDGSTEGWCCSRGGWDRDLPDVVPECGVVPYQMESINDVIDVDSPSQEPIRSPDGEHHDVIDVEQPAGEEDASQLLTQLGEIGSRADEIEALVQLEALADAAQQMEVD